VSVEIMPLQLKYQTLTACIQYFTCHRAIAELLLMHTNDERLKGTKESAPETVWTYSIWLHIM